MLYIITPKSGTWSVHNIREKMGSEWTDQIEHLTYDCLADRTNLRTGAYIFAGLGVVSPVQRALAVEAWTSLEHASSSVRLLNHPGRAMGRVDLLKTLHDEGRNDFRVFTPAEAAHHSPRYPVFVREAEYHTGNLTGLLTTDEALESALNDLARRGFAPSGLLVVEYCHTADEAGIFRKYSAFRIGDAILPRYLSLGTEWMVKENRSDPPEGPLYDSARLAEEVEYVRTNPHEAWLRETFELANIEYGRIDYGIWQGRLQVWEINTHPGMGAYPGAVKTDAQLHRRELRMPAKQHFYDRWTPVLADLAATPSDATVPFQISDALASRFAQDRKERARKERQRTSMNQLMRHAGRLIPKVPVLRPLRQAASGFIQRKITARTQISSSDDARQP
ncbi:MAG: hypothetical protein Rubg2KO_33250 [Rubricoccaceae bacterium]